MDDPVGIQCMNWLGADNCMWSIDFPHPESTYGHSGSVAQSVYEALGPEDAKKVLGGAVIGAVIGQAVGKDTKGTVIGAAAGAAAGTGVAMATGDFEGCINKGAAITAKLNAPATIQAMCR